MTHASLREQLAETQGPEKRLYLAAVHRLQETGNNTRLAADRLLKDLEADASLLLALFDEDEVRAAALDYLDDRRREIVGGPANARSPVDCADHKKPAPERRAGGGHPHRDTQPLYAASSPRPPSAIAVASAVARRSIFNRTIGGSLRLGSATRRDLQNYKRKFLAAGHVLDRLLTEIDWPDDDTPLDRLAGAGEVKRIFDSGAAMLDSLGLTNVGSTRRLDNVRPKR